MVTSFVLLSEGKISKKIKRKIRNFPKKTTTTQKIEKKERGKRGTISRGAHREGQSELC